MRTRYICEKFADLKLLQSPDCERESSTEDRPFVEEFVVAPHGEIKPLEKKDLVVVEIDFLDLLEELLRNSNLKISYGQFFSNLRIQLTSREDVF